MWLLFIKKFKSMTNEVDDFTERTFLSYLTEFGDKNQDVSNYMYLSIHCHSKTITTSTWLLCNHTNICQYFKITYLLLYERNFKMSNALKKENIKNIATMQD